MHLKKTLKLFWIMQRLLAYGVTPTGDKTTDRATLRRIEYQKAKEDNCVTNKYLTVSPQEQARMLEEKKAKRKENNPEKNQNKIKKNQTGAEYLGQQVYLAIKMKDKKSRDESDFKV